MKRITLILLLEFAVLSVRSQQNKNDFIFSLPAQPVTGSLYSTVQVIDDRYDTTNIGRIWVGIINDLSRESPAPPLPVAIQLQQKIQSALINSSGNSSLLIHLRFFKFSDDFGWPQLKCNCYFRAGLYEQSNDGYKRICMIDTVLMEPIPRSLQFPDKIFEKFDKGISELIVLKLVSIGEDNKYYTMAEILNTDSIEKRSIPVYNMTNFNGGVYKNYASFKTQQPDYTIVSADTAKGKISDIKAVKKSGRKVNFDKDTVYAVVYGNNIYLWFEKKFQPVIKIGDDFYMTAKTRLLAKNSTGRDIGNVLLDAPGYVFSPLGPINALATASNLNVSKHIASKIFEMKIDHLDGIPIKLKEIEKKGKSKVEKTNTEPIEKETPIAEVKPTTENTPGVNKEENKAEPQELQPY